ncbi:unnamed protein product, partial [Heterotrigona itama]
SARTSFSCLNKTAGFYADINASCKIYHTCDEYGNKFTHQCPEETAFRQDALICDHAHLVQCQGNALTNTKEIRIKEKEGDNSDGKNSETIEKNHDSSFSHATQPRKTNNGQRHGSVFDATHLFTNPNKTRIVPIEKYTTSSFSSFDYANSAATSNPVDCSTNTSRMQPAHDENNGSRRNEDRSIRSETDKLDEKSTRTNNDYRKDYPYRRINDAALYKTSRENNINYQATKNPMDLAKLPSTNYRNYPYLETLKSIQKNAKVASTTAHTPSGSIASTSVTITELPVHALTLSLKPLIPSEPEYDPYYPTKFSTTTESYYTTFTHNAKAWSHVGNSTTTLQISRSTIHLKLPSVLPDLNSLDDIVDRRKLLYIPRRTTAHAQPSTYLGPELAIILVKPTNNNDSNKITNS